MNVAQQNLGTTSKDDAKSSRKLNCDILKPAYLSLKTFWLLYYLIKRTKSRTQFYNQCIISDWWLRFEVMARHGLWECSTS